MCTFRLEKFDVDLVVQLDKIVYLVFPELSHESVLKRLFFSHSANYCLDEFSFLDVAVDHNRSALVVFTKDIGANVFRRSLTVPVECVDDRFGIRRDL